MARMRWRILLLFAVTLTAANSALAQSAETGAIVGHVLGTTAPLSLVTIEIRSPSLPGLRTQQTDPDGSFRFPLLPPGRYTLTAELPGFAAITQQGIVVNLAKTVTIDLTLHPAASQQIVVRASPPLLDVTSTLSGVDISAETMQSLPLARSYTAAAQVAPGVSNDGFGVNGATFYGSTSLENQYVIDGLNVTDPGIGMQNKDVNLDFVQEVEVMSGGLPAEYGRTTGGIVNAITKSGSNEFRGSLFGYTAGGRLRSKPAYLGKLASDQAQYSDVDRQFDYGGHVGGYILKDRLWFFAAYDRLAKRDVKVRLSDLTVPGFSVPAGGKIPNHTTGNLSAAKVSLAVTPNQSIHLSMFGDPYTIEGAVKSILGPPTTFEEVQKFGGNDFVGRYSGIFGKWNVNALAGRNIETGRASGPGATLPLLQDQSQSPTVRSGGLGGYGVSRVDRDVIKTDASGLFFGRHLIKFGADREKMRSKDALFLSGGDSIRKRCSARLVKGQCPSTAFVYYLHSTLTTDALNPSDPSTFQASITNPLLTRYLTRNQSAYLQDSWTAMSNVTVNAGIRFERQEVYDATGSRPLTVNNPAPRIGVVWDPFDDSRHKVYAYFGRLFESLTLDMDHDFGGGGGFLTIANLDPTPRNFVPDPRAPAFATTRTQYQAFVAGPGVPVDPHIKGQSMDEVLLGYDTQIGSSIVAGVKGTYRNMVRVIEDIAADPDGSRLLLGNPGSGLLSTTFMISGEAVRTPRPIRRYVGLEMHATERFSGNSQIFFSYLWSRLYGNYEGLYQQSAGQGNPNTNTAFDFGDFAINSYGPLTTDRTHQLKLYGSYQIPNGFASGLNVGIATHWYSGVPLAAMNRSFYGYSNYFLTPRGGLGRGPADTEADLHLGYPISVHHSRIEMIIDVFNLLNRQSATSLDLAYNAGSDPPCTGIPDALCNGDGGLVNRSGTTEPVGRLADPRASAPNPHFMKPNSFTGQRSIRLGARFQF